MAEVEVYYRDLCGFCARAEALLTRKGVRYQRKNIWESDAIRDEMIRRSGGRATVPQIFINGEHIGGSDDLLALDQSGGLDAKLGR